MKKLVAVLTLLLGCSCAANAGATKVDPAGYTIPVHVTAARWVPEGGETTLHLDVEIAGTKYELRGKLLSNKKVALLMPGNYKARVGSEYHDAAGAFARDYELLLLDGSNWQGTVCGVSE